MSESESEHAAEGMTEEATGVPPPTEPTKRRLMRSRDDRVIAGVCGGLGEYLGVDAVIIRIAALILLFAGGSGLLLYVIGWIAMPEEPAGGDATTPALAPGERTSGALVLGLVFVAIGGFFLLDQAFPDALEWEWIWPLALIAIGVLVLLRARR